MVPSKVLLGLHLNFHCFLCHRGFTLSDRLLDVVGHCWIVKLCLNMIVNGVFLYCLFLLRGISQACKLLLTLSVFLRFRSWVWPRISTHRSPSWVVPLLINIEVLWLRGIVFGPSLVLVLHHPSLVEIDVLIHLISLRIRIRLNFRCWLSLHFSLDLSFSKFYRVLVLRLALLKVLARVEVVAVKGLWVVVEHVLMGGLAIGCWRMVISPLRLSHVIYRWLLRFLRRKSILRI